MHPSLNSIHTLIDSRQTDNALGIKIATIIYVYKA